MATEKVILCVDDDRDVLGVLEEVLQGAGYRVVQAVSAEEALSCFRRSGADLVIADLMMETIDAGLELVRDLKIARQNLPIIMLSSIGDQLNGATDYSGLRLDGILQKPVRSEALLRLVAAKLSPVAP